MTTLLPTQDLAILRAIARTAAVLLVALRIDQLYPGRAIADYEIADILEADKRTVQKQLRSLSAAGMMLEQRNRYVVTTAGRNTLFGWSQEGLPEQTEQASLSIEKSPITSDLPALRAQCVQFMIDDDDIKKDSDSSSSIIPESTKCAQFLEATHILFGEAVSANCLNDHTKPTWVLAWVNKAFRDQQRLSNPQGLIYRRVASHERPPLWLEKEPTAGLPEEYLDAIGMFERACPRCEAPFTSLAEYSTHYEACLLTHFEEPGEEPTGAVADETVTEQVQVLWQGVLERLNAEFPKAQFSTWIKDTVPVHCDGTRLQVGVRNAFALQWLSSRLDVQMPAVLPGYQVQWVVAAETEEA